MAREILDNHQPNHNPPIGIGFVISRCRPLRGLGVRSRHVPQGERWCEARPRLIGGDFTHPTAQGSEIVGTLIYRAIVKAFEEYKAKSL